MRKEYTSFFRNMAASFVVGAMPGGAIGAELTSLITNSPACISIGSSIANYAGQSAVFLPLHYSSNRDIYTDPGTGKFKTRDFIKDAVKIAVAAVPIDLLIYTGRPLLLYWFQKRGMEPAVASVITDVIITPFYAGLMTFAGKKVNVIRRNGTGIQRKAEAPAEQPAPPVEATQAPREDLEEIIVKTKITPTPQE